MASNLEQSSMVTLEDPFFQSPTCCLPENSNQHRFDASRSATSFLFSRMKSAAVSQLLTLKTPSKSHSPCSAQKSLMIGNKDNVESPSDWNIKRGDDLVEISLFGCDYAEKSSRLSVYRTPIKESASMKKQLRSGLKSIGFLFNKNIDENASNSPCSSDRDSDASTADENNYSGEHLEEPSSPSKFSAETMSCRESPLALTGIRSVHRKFKTDSQGGGSCDEGNSSIEEKPTLAIKHTPNLSFRTPDAPKRYDWKRRSSIVNYETPKSTHVHRSRAMMIPPSQSNYASSIAHTQPVEIFGEGMSEEALHSRGIHAIRPVSYLKQCATSSLNSSEEAYGTKENCPEDSSSPHIRLGDAFSPVSVVKTSYTHYSGRRASTSLLSPHKYSTSNYVGNRKRVSDTISLGFRSLFHKSLGSEESSPSNYESAISPTQREVSNSTKNRRHSSRAVETDDKPLAIKTSQPLLSFNSPLNCSERVECGVMEHGFDATSRFKIGPASVSDNNSINHFRFQASSISPTSLRSQLRVLSPHVHDELDRRSSPLTTRGIHPTALALRGYSSYEELYDGVHGAREYVRQQYAFAARMRRRRFGVLEASDVPAALRVKREKLRDADETMKKRRCTFQGGM